MELYKMKKVSGTAWAFGSRIIKNDLNYLEVAGVESLTAAALDELTRSGLLKIAPFMVGVGSHFLEHLSAWAGGGLWFLPDSQRIREDYTLKTGETLRGSCVVGLALLLVFEEPNTGREVVYRVIE